MNLVITLTTAGTDTGPFNLYSNVDGYINAFDTDVSKAALLAGFATSNVPDGTTEIKIKSVNDLCNNEARAGTVPLEYYFIPSAVQEFDRFTADFIDNGSSAYVYGSFQGYYNGSYEVPGNLLVKLNTDLTVDTSFDIIAGFNLGIVYIGATMTKLLDGSLVIVGFFTSFNGVTSNRIIKLDVNGNKVITFNTGSGFNNYTTGISETIDNKYYISGHYTSFNGISRARIIRLLVDGSIDVAFNPGSGFNNATLSTVVDNDNSVYVGGYYNTYKGVTRNGIIKLNNVGNVDETFVVGTGFQPRGSYKGVLMKRIPGEDSIVCITYCSNCGVPNATTYQGVNYGNIVKLLPDGSVDATFAANSGTGFNGECGLISIVFGDKLLITSTSPNFTTYNGVSTIGAAILNKDGTLHYAFSQFYSWVYAIGNNLYGSVWDGPNELIYTYFP